MTIFNIIFYLAAAVVVCATGLAITRQKAVHAVCYLVISFMGTAVTVLYSGRARFLRPLKSSFTPAASWCCFSLWS